jgi:hypothetical protein
MQKHPKIGIRVVNLKIVFIFLENWPISNIRLIKEEKSMEGLIELIIGVAICLSLWGFVFPVKTERKPNVANTYSRRK